MKTIPVSFLLAGMLLPVVCLAQPPKPTDDGMGDPSVPPNPFQESWKLADTNGDGFISGEEFAAMPRLQNLPEEKRRKIFKRLDKDSDDRLSREELGRLGKNRDGKGGPPLQRIWELDADKSGGISFEEFKAGQMFMKLPPEKQQQVFDRLDTDGDGMITPKDRPQRPDGKPEKRGEGDPHEEDAMPQRINRKLDLDGDGALSFEEFRAGPAMKNLTEDEQEERFDLLDRNSDLKISPEDFLTPPAPPAD